MSKKTVGWLITAALLILIGVILFAGAMSMLKFDFRQLSPNHLETNRYDFEAGIRNIAVDTRTADVVFVVGDADTVSVECVEQTNLRHTVRVEDQTLSVTVHDTRKWYEHITFFNLENANITVALPQGIYNALTVTATTGDVNVPKDFRFESVDITATTGDVSCDASAVGAMNIHLTTGDITIRDTRAGSAGLTVTTGDIHLSGFDCNGALSAKVVTGSTALTDVHCESLVCDGTSGDLSLTNVVADGALRIERTTGDVRFDRCDAADITVTVTTGDVTGTVLTDKTFFAESTTGHVKTPNTAGGVCNVTATTGDIEIDIAK